MTRGMLLMALVAAAASCASDPGAELVFDLDSALTEPRTFFDAPWPSDLRVDAAGHPIVDGWPTRDSPLFDSLRASAEERRGFPVMPVAYFQFTKPVAARALDAVIPAARESPVLLVDV